MDRRVESLLVPSYYVAPREDQVVELSQTLRAEGKHADARLLIESVLAFAERTPTLVAEFALSTAGDESLAFGRRETEAMSILRAWEQFGEVIPLEMHRARAHVCAGSANRKRDLSSVLATSEDFLALSQRESGPEQIRAAIFHLHFTNCLTVFHAREDSQIALTQQVVQQTIAGRDITTKIISEAFSSSSEFGNGASTAVHLLRLVGLALTAYDIPENAASLDLGADAELDEAVLKILFAIKAESIRQSRTQSEWSCGRGLLELLARIASLRRAESPTDYMDALWNAQRLGRVGLALSGGGLRAAFFHMGTLALLAERDLLRYVEVISTVSGGSLAGTMYFLEVRALLAAKPGPSISQRDYIEVVQRAVARISEGTRQNLRMRAFGDYGHLKTAIVKGEFNRSVRIGALYDQYFYATYFPQSKLRPSLYEAGAVVNNKRIESPELFNQNRAAKLPELVINATSLTDGERFSFTPGWAGRRFNNRIGSDAFLQSIPLGLATAASSCVPGLFDAVSIGRMLPEQVYQSIYEASGRADRAESEVSEILSREDLSSEQRDRQASLYVSRIKRDSCEYLPIVNELSTQVVDGGLYDNLGLDALLEADCPVMICSDGASPFARARKASGDLGAAVRTNDILMKRVRDLIAEQARLRGRAGKASGVYIASLAELPTRTDADSGATTTWIDEALGADIKQIRTDLDAFSETEAAVLMATGYLAAKEAIPTLASETNPATIADSIAQSGLLAQKKGPEPSQGGWSFSPVLAVLHMKAGESVVRRKIGRQIAAAKYRFLRPFRVSMWHLLVAPIWLAVLLLVQWRYFDLQGAVAAGWQRVTSGMADLANALASSQIVETVGILLLLVVGLPLYLAVRYGAFDEQIGRIIEAVVVPRNFLRRFVASTVSILTIPLRSAWLWALDPLLQRGGRLSETLSGRPLTSTERSLKYITLAAILPFVATGLLSLDKWWTHDAEGRQKLALTAWSPDRCMKELREKETRDNGTVKEWVTIRDRYVEEIYCARRWDSKSLGLLAKEFTSIRELRKREDPFLRSLIDKSERADEFLRQQGAEEFVSFTTLRADLPDAYAAREGNSGVGQEEPSGEAQAMKLLGAKIPWDAPMTQDAEHGLTISIAPNGLTRIEVIQLHPAPLATSELAEWLATDNSAQLQEFEVRITPSLRKSVSQFLALIEQFRAPSDAQAGKADNAIKGGPAKKSESRSVQVIEVSIFKPEMCPTAKTETTTVVSCERDARVFVVHRDTPADVTGEASRDLLPKEDLEAVAKIIATKLP